jgi:hypothetical protein
LPLYRFCYYIVRVRNPELLSLLSKERKYITNVILKERKMNGKGDKDRTSDIKRYQDNYEKIFRTSTTSTTRRRTRYEEPVQERQVGRDTRRTG